MDPVRDRASRDVLVSTGLNLVYAINTHMHEDRISGSEELRRRIPGLNSVISATSGAKADLYIDDGDEVHFGNGHVIVIATPGQTPGCMSFLTDDGKAVLTGDALLAGGHSPVVAGGSAWLGRSVTPCSTV